MKKPQIKNMSRKIWDGYVDRESGGDDKLDKIGI